MSGTRDPRDEREEEAMLADADMDAASTDAEAADAAAPSPDAAADAADADAADDAPAERPADAWIVAFLFALAFVYDTVEAVTNLQQLPLLYIGADIAGAIPWWLLIAGVALPGLLFGVAVVLGRGRRIVAKAGILLVALAVSAQASLLAEQLARQVAIAALGG
ncbi:hypothetical protein LG314_09545 [Agrococcus terreus]|uniref:hypothetical protein n=1 Tax=Agrococcus terreus TaxID=574649 RepID=UPI0038508513